MTDIPELPADLPRQEKTGRLRDPVFEPMTRDHVLEALGDLDQGVDHPFSDPTTYELLHEGRPYPPKAVFGLAATRLLGGRVRPRDFSAGHDSKCFKKLKELGFEIRQIKPASYWALLCNPEVFDIERAVEEADVVSWQLPTGSPDIGDRLLIWKTQGQGMDRGLACVAEVLEGPEDRLCDEKTHAYFHQKPTPEKTRRIMIRLQSTASLPLWLNPGSQELLGQLTVASGQGNKLYKVTPAQWSQVMQRIGGWPADDALDQAAAADAAASASEPAIGGGQGLASSKELRDLTEQWAESRAIEYYEALGFDSVKRTPHVCPYDLVVQKGTQRLFVEVKGTRTAGEQVILTRNEVDHARKHPDQCVLFVLHSIKIVQTDEGALEAQGGEERIIAPWQPTDDSLAVISYRHTI